MSAVTAQQTKQKDAFEDLSKMMDFDDFTSSSVIEFLNKERECFNLDDSSEIDVDSIFEEINRLSDCNDDRSVDEILREAEILMSKQPLVSGCGIKSDGQHDFKKVLKAVHPDPVISQESTPKDMDDDSKGCDDSDNPEEIEEVVEGILTMQLNINEGPSTGRGVDNDNANCNNKNHTLLLSPSPPPEAVALPDENIKPKTFDHFEIKRKPSTTTNAEQVAAPAIFNKTFSRPNSTQSTYTERSFCDKSTNSSPVRSVAVKTSPIDNMSFIREHALKNEIEQFQEKLKDTEERLQSLKIQHDSLSQIHRDLRESHSHLQEESELLKLDVQHLTECANILRTELHSARNDRNEALEVQKILQNELEESRSEKKKAQEQCEKDSKTIQDLQRQCREMERILMRKHPDSVSALIVAAKNPGKATEDSSASRRLLEQRIAQLESDAKNQDFKAQKILANVQARFNSVQAKYETHIADLETQVLSLQEINTKLNEKIESQIIAFNSLNKNNNNLVNIFTQTDDIAERECIRTNTISTQTDSRPPSGLRQPQPVKKHMGNKMSASHFDTASSTYHIAAKEDAHLLATIRGMRVDLAIKDKALQRLTKELEECKKTIKKLQKEKDSLKAEKQLPCASSSRKTYDPNHYAEQSAADAHALKEALNKIKLLEFDYKALHDKRLQDLKTLQAAHERELASCHETVRILQQRLAERDEAYASTKRRKVPIDYYALKAKVSSLERRHSEREQRLHMLVEALSKGRLNGALEEILTDNNQ